jgi:hypothetical protein
MRINLEGNRLVNCFELARKIYGRKQKQKGKREENKRGGRQALGAPILFLFY